MAAYKPWTCVMMYCGEAECFPVRYFGTIWWLTEIGHIIQVDF